VRFHAEAAFFCLVWVALAASGFALEGWIAGGLLSLGLMAVLMPTSAVIISRTEDPTLESTVRWAILLGAGLILALVHALGD
jgi:hypothetical protein